MTCSNGHPIISLRELCTEQSHLAFGKTRQVWSGGEKKNLLDLHRPLSRFSGEPHQSLREKRAIRGLIQEEAQQNKQLVEPSAAQSFLFGSGEKCSSMESYHGPR